MITKLDSNIPVHYPAFQSISSVKLTIYWFSNVFLKKNWKELADDNKIIEQLYI